MRIDISSFPQLKTEAGTPAQALEALSPGDTVSARVASVGGDRLMLRFPGGTAAAVSQKGAPALSPGDTLELLIKEKSGGQVFVEITGVTPAETGGDLSALLRSMGLSADEAQLLVAGELLSQGLPLTKESVSAAAGLLTAFKALTPGQAVFMTASEVPPGEDTAQQLSALLEHKGELGGRLLTLLSLLEEGGSSPLNPEAAAQSPAGETDAVPLPSQSRPPQEGTQITVPAEAPEQAGEAAPSPATGLEKGVPPSPDKGASPTEEAFSPKPSKTDPTASSPLPAGSTLVRAEPPDGEAAAAPQPATASPQTGQPHQPAATGNALPEKGVSPAFTGERVSPEPAPLPSTPTTETELPKSIRPGEHEASAIGGKIPSPAPEQASPPPAAEIKASLLSLFRRIGGDGRELARSLDGRRVAEELSETFASLREHARTLPPERQAAVLAAVRDTEQSLGFLNNLSQLGRLVQIPVQLGDLRTTAELLVFRDGMEKRPIDPQNATLFLSLATANMGRVETFVRVVGKNVECDFSLAGAQALETMRDNAGPLYSMLEAEGYRLVRASFTLEERPAGLPGAGEKKRAADKRLRIDLKI